MKQFLALTKVLFKTNLGGNKSQNSKPKKVKNKFGVEVTKESSSSAPYIIIGICFIPLAVLLYHLSVTVTEALMTVGAQSAIISLIYSIVTIVAFLMGFTLVLSVFYYSGDSQNLLHMPIKGRTIVASKTFITLVFEYPLTLLFLVPFVVGYGTTAHAGPIFWVTMVISALLVPAIPLVYAGIISMVVMRISKAGKRRDLFTIIITLIIIVAAIGINVVSQSASRMSPDALASKVTDIDGMIGGIIMKVFPMLIPLKEAIINENILMFILFIACVIALLIIFLFLAEKLYIKGITDISDSVSKGKALTEKETKKIIRKKNPIITYMFKDMKILLRTPAFLLNCVLMGFIFPVIILVPTIAGFSSSGVDLFSALQGLSDAGFMDGIAILAGFVMTGLVGWFSLSSCFAITMEGKNYFFMKYIPMSVKDQLHAKVAAGSAFGIISSVAYNIILLAIMKAGPLCYVFCIAFAVFAIIFFNFVQLSLDLSRPKLEWENETVATKQNINALFAILLILVISLISCGGAIALYILTPLSIYIIGLILVAAFVVLDILANKIVIKKGERIIAKL